MVLVVFGTKMRKDADLDEYVRHSQRMNELVKQIPGSCLLRVVLGPGLHDRQALRVALKTGRIDRFVAARNSG